MGLCYFVVFVCSVEGGGIQIVSKSTGDAAEEQCKECECDRINYFIIIFIKKQIVNP